MWDSLPSIPFPFLIPLHLHPLPIHCHSLRPHQLYFQVCMDEACFNYVAFVLIISIFAFSRVNRTLPRGSISRSRGKAVPKRLGRSAAFWMSVFFPSLFCLIYFKCSFGPLPPSTLIPFLYSSPSSYSSAATPPPSPSPPPFIPTTFLFSRYG